MTNLEASKALYEWAKSPKTNAVGAERLILEGADINYRHPDYGYTPLHMAAYYGNKEKIEFLLKLGCDKNAYSNDIKTPLDLAIERHDEKSVIKLMTSQGCKTAEDKESYFVRKLSESKSPFIFGDYCILQAIIGEGTKIYAVKATSISDVNLYGGDDVPELIGATNGKGELFLDYNFISAMWFTGDKNSYKTFFDAKHQYQKDIYQYLKEIFQYIGGGQNIISGYAGTSNDRKITALLGNRIDTILPLNTLKVADLICGKVKYENYLQSLIKHTALMHSFLEREDYILACQKEFENKLEPYEIAIANALKEVPNETPVYYFLKNGSNIPSYPRSVEAFFRENIDRLNEISSISVGRDNIIYEAEDKFEQQQTPQSYGIMR